MLYSTQSIHKFFICVLFETHSKSSLCPCQLKKLRTKLLTYLYPKFSALLLKPFRFPRYTYLFTHNLTRSPLLSTWVTHVKQMRRVRGTFVQFLRANSFFIVAINTPSLPHFTFTLLVLTPAQASETLVPPLLHRRW